MSFDEAYNEQKIINVEINREVRKSFLDYSMSVITSRALPDVRDGLKLSLIHISEPTRH